MRVVADLLERIEAETPYGGRAVSYEPVGVVWLEPGRTRRRERSEAGGEAETETLEAVAPVDARLSEGRVLRFGGGDWRVRGVDVGAGRTGRVTLNLERDR